jgi:hypothetical protein
MTIVPVLAVGNLAGLTADEERVVSRLKAGKRSFCDAF